MILMYNPQYLTELIKKKRENKLVEIATFSDVQIKGDTDGRRLLFLGNNESWATENNAVPDDIVKMEVQLLAGHQYAFYCIFDKMYGDGYSNYGWWAYVYAYLYDENGSAVVDLMENYAFVAWTSFSVCGREDYISGTLDKGLFVNPYKPVTENKVAKYIRIKSSSYAIGWLQRTSGSNYMNYPFKYGIIDLTASGIEEGLSPEEIYYIVKKSIF